MFRESFIKAFQSNVGNIDTKIIQEYLDNDDEDAFFKKYPNEYTKLADALGMWVDAIKYYKESRGEAVAMAFTNGDGWYVNFQAPFWSIFKDGLKEIPLYK